VGQTRRSDISDQAGESKTLGSNPRSPMRNPADFGHNLCF
jgi:hypothetical protein